MPNPHQSAFHWNFREKSAQEGKICVLHDPATRQQGHKNKCEEDSKVKGWYSKKANKKPVRSEVPFCLSLGLDVGYG